MQDHRTRAAALTAYWGIAANLFLMAAKLFIGWITKSQGMLADGFNSAGDVFASMVTLLGSRVAGRPGDKGHPFGHGKAEYLASLAIALSMAVVAFAAGRSAVASLTVRSTFTFSPWLIAVAVFTIFLKLFLFFYTRAFGRKYQSLLILANCEDHRNDVFITGGTLIGILGSLAGLWWLDGAVGILICLWIGYTAVRILILATRVLMDTAMDPAMQQHLSHHILNIPQVHHIDSISSIPVGARYILIIKVSVPPDMTVADGHAIAGHIKALLMDHHEVADAVVHINPDFTD